MELVEQLLQGDRRAAARLITLIENGDGRARQAISELFRLTGRARVVGITGPPGTGKSTLVAALAKEERRRGRSVGIISIDPTSPFTGGALLGDRIRMQELTGDQGVFMRSMASRGNLGGLSAATADAIRVLDAFGKDTIFVETVGAGQAEVDIVRAAQTTVVVEAPGLGDDIQAFKAGILEIADVFVVNKADREGADRTASALTSMLDLGNPVRRREDHSNTWRPPILKTVATDEAGIAPLADAIDRHADYLKQSGQAVAREREQIGDELRRLVARGLLEQRLRQIGESEFARTVEDIAQRRLDPHAAAHRLMKCPRCGANNADNARFCANCAQPLAAQVIIAPSGAAMQSLPDPNTAFVLEFVLGLFGFMGIGWVYGRRTTVGLVILVGWWLLLATGIGGSVVSGGLGCCLWLPVHFVAPFISAILVRNEIEKNPWGPS